MPKLEAFKKFTHVWSKWFNYVAIAMVAVMLLLTVSDIIGSKLKMPLPGFYDITGFVLLLVCAFGIAQAEVRGRHIRIDIILVRFPERLKGAFGIFSNIVSAAVIALLVVTSFHYGQYTYGFKLVTMDLLIPHYPFAFAIALGCLPLVFVLIEEVFESIKKARGQ